MNRRKLTALIVTGALAAVFLGMALLKRSEPAAPPDPAATTQDDAKRPADVTPAQIQQAPQSTQDVFMPPPSDATGTSPAPR